MRRAIQSIYTVCLIGLAVLLLLAGMALGAALPSAIAAGQDETLTIGIAVVAGLISGVVLLPGLAPGWLMRPAKLRHWVGLILVSPLFTGLLWLAIVSALAMNNVAQSEARAAVLFLAWPVAGGLAISFVAGLVLSLWPIPPHLAFQTKASASDPARLSAATLRAMRQSRMRL